MKYYFLAGPANFVSEKVVLVSVYFFSIQDLLGFIFITVIQVLKNKPGITYIFKVR